MQVKILTLAFDAQAEGFSNEQLEQFLAGKAVHRLQTEFFQQNGQAYWSFLIEYEAIIPPHEQKKSEVKFDAADQQLLVALQEWRRDKAKEDGVPVYVIATNKEMEAIVVQKPRTQETLKNIAGFGQKKCQRHGEALLAIVQRYTQSSFSPAISSSKISSPAIEPSPQPEKMGDDDEHR